jgi:uncharacterized protein (TIGR00730 family)
MKKLITVFGGSQCNPDSAEYRDALALGRLLAQRGFTVVCGGYSGVMEAVSRGAREAGGRVVGVTVDAFRDRTPNPYLSVDQPTPDLLERLRVLTEEPDGFVVLPGSIGTAAELFLLWNLLWMKLRPPAPVVLLGNRLEQVLGPGSDGLGIPPEALRMISFARTPEEAVQLALGEAR